MAAIDYSGIQDAIEAILQADSSTSDARIFVEEEPQPGLMDKQKAVAIFLDDRRAPAGEQGLVSGKRTRMHLKMSIWTLFLDMESYRKACQGRNSLLGNVELVLMANRTLNNKVATSWLEGGAILSARSADNQWFVAAAETILTCEVSAINT